MSRKGPIHIVINPRSGAASKRQALADLRAALRAKGLETVDHQTTGPGEATDYTAAHRDSARAFLAWGGDGTAREVTSGLINSDVPVLSCPAGTENLLAKELRIPSDPAKLAAIVEQDHSVACDMATVNGQNFLMIVGVGFDGEVVRRLTAVRRGHITHLSYFWPIWRTFWEHDFPRLTIHADGQKIFDDYGLAFVGNISRYAAGLRICPEARFDDGLLDLVIFSAREQSALMLHAAWTLLRLHPLRGDVTYRQVKTIRVETAEPVPSQMDGDLGPSTPLDIALAGKVRLLVPATTGPSAWDSIRRQQSKGAQPWKG
jgi:YegS/Rv2252/BmrU family lipid kinase